MEKVDLKGKRKIEDVYETQVAANNHMYQHEDAMMTVERANNYDYDNQEAVLTDEDREFLSEIYQELLSDGDQCINDYNNQELPADQDLPYLGDCQNNDVLPSVQLGELPPGFVFNPSDQELLSVYLKPKIGNPEIRFAVMPCIPDISVYEYHPEKLLEIYQEKSGYFFTQRTKRHANGTRPTRTVGEHGHWRMSTKTEPVMEGSKEVGKKSGFVFHTVGRPGDKKSDTKTDWLMKEYLIPGSECTLCKIYLNK